MDQLNSFLSSKLGHYVGQGIMLAAGYFGFTPDPTATPVISNFVLSCLLGGIAMIYGHFAHKAALNAEPPAPKA